MKTRTMTTEEYRAAVAKEKRHTKRTTPTPEALVMRAVRAYLEIEQQAGRLDYARMNTGATKIGDQLVQFGISGMADFYVRVPKTTPYGFTTAPWRVLWLEVKAPGEKQTENQLAFERRATLGWGDLYRVATNEREAQAAVEAARRG